MFNATSCVIRSNAWNFKKNQVSKYKYKHWNNVIDWYKSVSFNIYTKMEGNVNLYVSLINVNTAINMHCKMFNRSGWKMRPHKSC